MVWSPKMLEAIEVLIDHLKGRLRRRYAINRLQIMAYPGFCNDTEAFVRGRVLVGKEVELGGKDHGAWRNFGNMLKRFLSAEIPHAVVEVKWQGNRRRITCNHEGFFFERLPINPADELEVHIRAIEPQTTQPVELIEKIFPPAPGAELVVVSDIDDTVLLTMASKAVKMVLLTLFGNAHTRKMFAGVSDWYRALQRGRDGKRHNLFFYVSTSPWNLYDFLDEFLAVNRIPRGPLFLKDHGLEEGKFNFHDHRSHKVDAIEKLLVSFPDRPFLLIGDSGQKDPEIYQEIVKRHPGRVLGVLIRNVTAVLIPRTLEIERIGREIGEYGVKFLLFTHTKDARSATAEWGLLPDAPKSDSEPAKQPNQEGEASPASTSPTSSPPSSPEASAAVGASFSEAN